MNMKKELLEEIGGKEVLCISLTFNTTFDAKYARDFNLPCNFTDEDFEAFLESINFDYDDGFGSQELDGVIWYTDGTWSVRGEYDGSEWWDYQSVPAIPEELR